MTKFVGDDATQNYWQLELGTLSHCEMQGRFVIDTGQDRMDCKTEDFILELILDGRSEHSQTNVGSFGSLLAESLRAGSGLPHRTL